MFPGFLENLLESRNSSVVLWLRQKPHWVSSSFGSTQWRSEAKCRSGSPKSAPFPFFKFAYNNTKWKKIIFRAYLKIWGIIKHFEDHNQTLRNFKLLSKFIFINKVPPPRRFRSGPRAPAPSLATPLVQLFLRHLNIHSSWEAQQRDAAVVGSFTPVSRLCMGTINLPIFRHPSRTPCHLAHRSVCDTQECPLDTQESAKSSSFPSYPNSLSNFSQINLSSGLAAAS